MNFKSFSPSGVHDSCSSPTFSAATNTQIIREFAPPPPIAAGTRIRCALLGSPIAHSRSPMLQQTLAAVCGFSMQYDLLDTLPEQFFSHIVRLYQNGYIGCNCTMPLKLTLAQSAAQITPAVARLGSANTFRFSENGTLLADTTDGYGITAALLHHGCSLRGKRILLIGAGGAARSIVDALIQGDAAQIIICNRTPRVLSGIQSVALDAPTLRTFAPMCDIVIQASSLGMHGMPPLPDLTFLSLLPAHAVVMDAVYTPLMTDLLRVAKSCGLHTINGLWMLLYQGVRSFTFFTGITPDADAISAAYQAIQMEHTRS